MPDQCAACSSGADQRAATHADECAASDAYKRTAAVPDQCAAAASAGADQCAASDANQCAASDADECAATLPDKCPSSTADADQRTPASLIKPAELATGHCSSSWAPGRGRPTEPHRLPPGLSVVSRLWELPVCILLLKEGPGRCLVERDGSKGMPKERSR